MTARIPSPRRAPRPRSARASSRPVGAVGALAPAAAAALLLAAASAPAAAQTPDSATAASDSAALAADTFAVPGIVVTATRVPLHRRALATPVHVLTGRELRERGIRTVAEALREVPGAAVVRAGAEGAQTSLFLRGGESDYVKVLVDGIAVNDPGGAIDLADLTTDRVERIEVVRGPASVLYGADAVSGVVQVFTRRGAGAPAVTARAGAGMGSRRVGDESYGTFDADATASGALNAWSYAVGAGRSWSEGLHPFNGERGLTTGSVRLGWSPAAGAQIDLASRVTDSRSHFPTDGTGALVDENARLDRRLWSTSLEAGWPLHERVSAHVRLGAVRRSQSSVDRPDDDADTLGVFATELDTDLRRDVADARVDVTLPRATLSVGAEVEDARVATRYASSSQWGPSAAETDHRRSSRGYYAQLLAEPLRGAHLTLGGRVDDADPFGTFETWRLGLAVQALPGVRVRAALGRGFRSPTFGESFGSGFGDLGNAGLVPERSRSREAGVDAEAGPATVAATWFDQRFDDLIQFTFSPPQAGDPNYYNVGRARARGLELEGRVSGERFTASASFTWLDTEVLDPGLATDAGFVLGQPLLRRPARSGSLTGRARLGRGTLGATLHLVGEREDLDFAAGFPAPRITLDRYATLDLAFEHPVPAADGAADVVLRAENVLDAEYSAVAGYAAPGRLLGVGVRLRLP